MSLLLAVEFDEPHIVLLQLVLNDFHAQRADLEVDDDAMEVGETREAEEYVDDVRRQLGATLLPVFTQDACQCSHNSLCIEQY